jgi:hypothetical protein
MKRLWLFLPMLLMFSAMAFASPNWGDGWDQKKHHHPQAVPELGVAPMLVLSAGAIAGGLILKRRRNPKTAS